MKLPINRRIRAGHLKDHRVIDPIAHGVVFQRTVGNGGGEGKRGSVQDRELNIEIDSADFAGGKRRKRRSFAFRIGAGESDAQIVSEHEADNGSIQIGFGSNADSHDDRGIRLERGEPGAGVIVYRNAEDLSAAIAKAVIDVGDLLLDLHGGGWYRPACGTVGSCSR